MSKEHQFEKLRDRVKMERIEEACIVRVKDVKGICPPNYEKTDSRLLISPKIMDVKNFVMVYNEVEEHGGVKMHEHTAEHGYFVIEGKMLLCIGKEEKEVEAGAAIHISSGVRHGFRSIGKGKLRLILIYSPPDRSKR
jgi:mannose-6-phosphate isomerase-like protein (cupin superfamily)